mmetsp:Transcript_340/g.629  ORF Transcript_340/g.629 Transcript_340/m.629 type:complete len:657 (+) Transcript_340:241-2211(+)
MKRAVVGAIRGVRRHPEADRLSVCDVCIGDGRMRTIVCGAPNVRDGQFVAVLPVGSVLEYPKIDAVKAAPLEFGKLKIKKSKLRGQESEGMICSLQELGFVSSKVDLHQGIWDIDQAWVEESGVQVGDALPSEWEAKLAQVEIHTLESAREGFDRVVGTWKELKDIMDVSSLLQWDQQVMMPQSGGNSRGGVRATMSGIHYSKATAPEYAVALEEHMNNPGLSAFEKRSVELALRDYRHTNVVSSELVTEMTRLSSVCAERWAKAREMSKFQIVQPVFADLLALKKEAAKVQKEALPEYEYANEYHVMMSEYVSDVPPERVNDIFETVREELIPFVKSAKSPSESLMVSESDAFEIKKQHELSSFALKTIMGKDLFSQVRFDESTHPFSIALGAGDARITTRFLPLDMKEGLMATCHEMGHCLYELGLPKKARHFPAAQFLDVGTHETQSLFWERMVGQQQPFWRWLAPKVKQNFGYGSFIEGEPIDLANKLVSSVNILNPLNPIRVKADELHYPIHVMIRYEIEQELVSGELAVKDLPARWNHAYDKYLGIKVENDAQGCLQDPHFYMGALGYFPSYTIGAIGAVQLYDCMKAQVADVEQKIQGGDFKAIIKWLNENVHARGRMDRSIDALCEEVTGKPLDTNAYVDYLKTKYSA